MKDSTNLPLRIFYGVTILAYCAPLAYFVFLVAPGSNFQFFLVDFYRNPDTSLFSYCLASLILIPYGYRIYSVIHNPNALTISNGLETIRGLGIILMIIGLVGMIMYHLFFIPDDLAGHADFLIAILNLLFAIKVVIGLFGIILFEITGLCERDKSSRDFLKITSMIVACSLCIALFFFIHALNGEYNKNKVLLKAASNGDYALVKSLVIRGADVNCDKCSSILYGAAAAYRANPKVVALLIEKGAKVNAKKFKGETPLHVAVDNPYSKLEDRLEMTKLLIAGGANVNMQADNGDTPLHKAAQSNELSMIKLLVAHGAKINVRNQQGITPLGVAGLASDYGETAQWLASQGAVLNPGEFEQLSNDAALHGKIRFLKVLIAGGANVNIQADNGDTPLHKAAQNNNLSMIKLLVAHGAKVNVRNQQGITPLGLAGLSSDYGEAAQWLADHGAVLDPGEFEQLSNDAALRGKIRFLKVLIAHGAKFTPDKTDEENRDEKIALHQAIKCRESNNRNSNCFDIVKLLLEQGADPNEKDKYGVAALHIAASLGAEDIAGILLAHGAEVNSRAKDGHTPLHSAVMKIYAGSDALIELLLDKGADINATDSNNETPLGLAKRRGNRNAVRLLRSCGTDVHAACEKRP